jgi:SAM-dependent methyltransferase
MQESEFHNLATVEDRHWWSVGMAAIATDWLQRLTTARTLPPQRLLDAGCGTGGALTWLAPFGQVHGTDRHPLALRYAANGNRRRLVRADVGELPFAANSFSVLTSFDVLYHHDVTDDWTALREFARVLRPGGWLLLRVPAHNWLRGAHDDAVQTRHRYNRQEIIGKLVAVGLRPVRVTYVNALLLLPAIVWRVVQRVRGHTSSSDLRLPPRPINAMLKAMLYAERAWLRHCNLPVGLSLLALAQKEIP